VSIKLSEAMRSITVVVRIRHAGMWMARLWLAKLLFYIGARIAGMGVEFENTEVSDV